MTFLQTVDPPMHDQSLALLSGIPRDGALADAGNLLDDVQPAEPVRNRGFCAGPGQTIPVGSGYWCMPLRITCPQARRLPARASCARY
jgi:hypothetical protein